MSRERAHRRAEREAQREVERAARARQVARRARLRAVRSAVVRPLGAVRAGRRRPDSALRRQRFRQNLFLVGLLVAGNGLLWLVQPSWVLRGTVLALSVLAWPLLVVLVFDRRRSA